eukprot:CAMPEP_0114123022 /NCGR_PEP_ID=MMETSP0043_2-20121206/8002_1 /TAXON_ID=464988 /ORGANISM="Hemiselmis andersenii, Strain CCMP644" /LENGTH=89 /DNA_ID=CAMNT_0001215767 /DNA_START=150 /DNA_END=416 /DNA_ORIENTATION=-
MSASSPLASPRDALGGLHHLSIQSQCATPPGSITSFQVKAQSKADWYRQSEICTHQYDLSMPPSPQPRGYAAPQIRRIRPSSRLLRGTG